MELIAKEKSEMETHLRNMLITHIKKPDGTPDIPQIQSMVKASCGKEKLQDMDCMELAKFLNSLLILLQSAPNNEEENFLNKYFLE